MEINLAALEDGLIIPCVGFSVVFFFLTIMIFAMMIMGKVVAYLNKVFPVAVQTAPVKSSSSSNDEEIAVAIAACFAKQHG